MKKIVSILLAVLLVASLVVTASAYSVYTDGFTTTSDDAIKAYEAENSVTVETRKYFFQMPNGENGPVATDDVTYTTTDDTTGEKTTTVICKKGDHAPTWYHDGFTEGAGIYWWGSAEASPDGWAGYRALVEDADHCIFYANVPKKAVTIIWNNGIDGGQTPTAELDPADDIYYKAAQTVDVGAEYPDPGEYVGMPEGRKNKDGGFDNCIYIVNPDKVEQNPFSLKMTCGGSWYFYYGNGCYGMYAETSAKFTSYEDNCVNPDHFVDGVHVGFSSVLAGDADGDGKITIMDATRIQRYIAKLIGEDGLDMTAADADGDGKVTVMDATRIQRYLAKLCNIDGSTPYVEA